jgi:hypothetical protein
MNNRITENDLCELNDFEYIDFVLIYSTRYWNNLYTSNLHDYFWTTFLSKDWTKVNLYLPHRSMASAFNE